MLRRDCLLARVGAGLDVDGRQLAPRVPVAAVEARHHLERGGHAVAIAEPFGGERELVPQERAPRRIAAVAHALERAGAMGGERREVAVGAQQRRDALGRARMVGIVDERRLIVHQRLGRAAELLVEDVAGQVAIARAQRRVGLEAHQRVERGQRLVPALQLDGIVEDRALGGAMRRIERDRAAVAGQRRRRVTAGVRALSGEERHRRALALVERLAAGGQRLDAALGAVDVAVGEQPLGLQSLHVAALGRQRDGALDRLGRERAIAGGAGRAGHQQPALDRGLGARQRQRRRQLEHVGVMTELLADDARAPAGIDVPRDALDQHAQLRERAFEIAARLRQRRRLRHQRQVRMRPADRVVDEPGGSLHLAALAQVRDQRHPHGHRRAVGVERALEQLARAIAEVGPRRAQLGRAQQAMGARASVGRQRRPALEAIDRAVAGVDGLVQRHQRLQRVDRVGLALEHRLPALDRLVRIAEVARVHARQLAPQRRSPGRIDGLDVARALVGERGEPPFGAVEIGERAPAGLVGLVLEQPLQRLDGAPALAELGPRRRQRALQRPRAR